MREELRVINALVGMTTGGGSWPTPLKAMGFTLTSIQRPVVLILNGDRRTVVPEAVFDSVDEGSALLVESKSASFNESQARRYLAVSTEDLVTSGAIPEPLDKDAHVVAPIYFCHALHETTLGEVIEFFNQSGGHELPLVSYDNHSFCLVAGLVRNARVHSLFDGQIHFNEIDWPTRFVPFDAESPDAEVVATVMAELGALLLDPEISEFSVDQIAGGHPDAGTDGAVPHYSQLGTDSRKRVRARVAALVEGFRRSYGTAYFDRKSKEKAWTKIKTVTPGTALKSFRAKSIDFSRRVQEDRPLPKDTQKPALISQIRLEEAGE